MYISMLYADLYIHVFLSISIAIDICVYIVLYLLIKSSASNVRVIFRVSMERAKATG